MSFGTGELSFGTDKARRKGFVIAVDGPAASGKGTIARAVAQHYGLPHMDTGLLYRAVALKLWRWGGDAETIKASILHGRVAAMPAWGQVIGEAGVKNVAAYVRSDLAGLPLPEEADADTAAGGQVYAQTCAVCHGANGEGMAAMGAPKLTSSAGWIYGSTLPQLQQTIRHGRNGQMPAQEQYLGNDKVHLLAAYVYSLSQQPERLAKQ